MRESWDHGDSRDQGDDDRWDLRITTCYRRATPFSPKNDLTLTTPPSNLLNLPSTRIDPPDKSAATAKQGKGYERRVGVRSGSGGRGGVRRPAAGSVPRNASAHGFRRVNLKSRTEPLRNPDRHPGRASSCRDRVSDTRRKRAAASDGRAADLDHSGRPAPSAVVCARDRSDRCPD